MELGKYSMGVGDRFGFECQAQVRALQRAGDAGVRIVPVWNKSHREHTIAGTQPGHARSAADEAVRASGWNDSYFVDADHVTLGNVDPFIPCSDYFTIDIADYIGKPTDGRLQAEFMTAMKPYRGLLEIAGMQGRIEITESLLEDFSRKYLDAIRQAGEVYRHIAETKGPDGFITEISADEAQSAQTPVDMLLLLAAIAREGIPIQAIAPKFIGRFLKGTDYVGDPNRFDRQFRDDLAVIAFAVHTFPLPRNLKLSIHTGSDKFTLYPLMHRAIREADTGIHLKTAGTTWLEEAAGLAACGGEGLALVKEIYEKAFARCDQLCEPYLAVISIEKSRLPFPAEVSSWSSREFIDALRHDPRCPAYNSHFRQLLHVGFKVAAETGERFKEMLVQCRDAIEENVTRNLFENHIRPLYIGTGSS